MAEDLYFESGDMTVEQFNEIYQFANSIGVSPTVYESIVYRRWDEEMGFCGCGDPDGTASFVGEILAAYKKRSKGPPYDFQAVDNSIGNNPEYAALLIKYVLDAMGLTEHGTNVDGGWLTEKGEKLLAEIRKVEEGPK